MRLTVVTEPTQRILTLDEVKNFLKIEEDHDDDVLDSLIFAATKEIQEICSRTILTTVYDYYVDELSEKIKLPMPPLISVDSVKYIDSDDVEQTIGPSNYNTVITDVEGFIEFVSSYALPTIKSQSHAVTIRFTAGYGDAWVDIPNSIRVAAQLIVERDYDRDIQSRDYFEKAIRRQLMSYRIISIK